MSYVTNAAAEFVLAETEEAQEQVLETYKAGTIRKGLRHLALAAERRGETVVADQAWALRAELAEDTVDVHFEPEFELAS